MSPDPQFPTRHGQGPWDGALAFGPLAFVHGVLYWRRCPTPIRVPVFVSGAAARPARSGCTAMRNASIAVSTSTRAAPATRRFRLAPIPTGPDDREPVHRRVPAGRPHPDLHRLRPHDRRDRGVGGPGRKRKADDHRPPFSIAAGAARGLRRLTFPVYCGGLTPSFSAVTDAAESAPSAPLLAIRNT